MNTCALHVLPFALLASPALAQIQGAATSRQRAEITPTNEIVVQALPGCDVAGVADDLGLGVVGSIPGSDLFLLSTGPGASALEQVQALGALGTHPAIGFAEFNAVLFPPEVPGCAPEGEVGGQQCTIAFYDGNPAPETYSDQPAMPAIQAADAQAYLTGQTTLVAVIDTGVDPNHPELVGRLFAPGYDFVTDQAGAWDVADFVDDDGDGLVDEAYGHGTHVSATITLINPDSVILPFRVLDSDGNGTAFDVAEAICAAVYAGSDVINLSLGMSGPSMAVAEALDLAHAADVNVFAAAGNTGSEFVLFPASYDHVVSVAAVDYDDTKAPFSSFGHAVDLSAPGVDIYSAMPGEAYAWWSGTSMATAVASGCASLLHSVDLGSPDAVEEALEEASAELDALNPTLEDMLGEGRVDLLGSVLELIDELDD